MGGYGHCTQRNGALDGMGTVRQCARPMRAAVIVLCLAVFACASPASAPATTRVPFASAPAPASSFSTPAPPPPPVGEALTALFGPADIGSDARFQETLAAHKHYPEIAAPARLRKLIELLGDPGYFSLGVALDRHGDRLRLGWSLMDLKYRGELPDVRSRLWAALESLGLAPLVPPVPIKAGAHQVWTAARGAVTERALLEDRGPTVGGEEPREPGYAISLYWSEEAAVPAAPITVRSAVAAFPFFKLAGVDAAVYDELADEPIDFIGVGGSWTRFYNFAVTLVSATDARVGQLLSSTGFVDDDRHERGERTFRRERSGSFAYVGDRDAKGRLGLRFHPFSW